MANILRKLKILKRTACPTLGSRDARRKVEAIKGLLEETAGQKLVKQSLSIGGS